MGAGPWNADIFRAHPDVTDAWSLPRHLPLALNLTWPRVIAALHRSRPAPVYVCEPHERQLVRVRRLLKYGGIDPCPLPLHHRSCHRARTNTASTVCCDSARRLRRRWAIGLLAPVAGPRCSPRLQVLDEERRARDAWLRAKGWYGRELVLIQPGNFRSMSGNHATTERRAADDKAWPAQHWQQLFRLVHAHLPAALIVLCGASSEASMLRSLRDAVGLEGGSTAWSSRIRRCGRCSHCARPRTA